MSAPTNSSKQPSLQELLNEFVPASSFRQQYETRREVRSILRPGSEIFLLGEAPGKDEEERGEPFVGATGLELQRLLHEVNLTKSGCSYGNVFTRRPRDNDLSEFCVGAKARSHRFPTPFQRAGYLHPDLEFEVDRVQDEIRQVRPNIVVALGGTALWALTGHSTIKKIRGTIIRSPLVQSKVLATYHPAAIFREWPLRVIVKADLMKAARESAFPDFRFPSRRILIPETLDDIGQAIQECSSAPILSVDIETARRQITCIGFAVSSSTCYTFPFTSRRSADGNYWNSQALEASAWEGVRAILAAPNTKLFQNGLYDIQWLLHYGLNINGAIEDTLIAHHALFPELPKGLDFLGSSYTTEQPWKLYRRRGDDAVEKPND